MKQDPEVHQEDGSTHELLSKCLRQQKLIKEENEEQEPSPKDKHLQTEGLAKTEKSYQRLEKAGL